MGHVCSTLSGIDHTKVTGRLPRTATLEIRLPEGNGIGRANICTLVAAYALITVDPDVRGLLGIRGRDLLEVERGPGVIHVQVTQSPDAVSGRDLDAPVAVDAFVLIDFVLELAEVTAIRTGLDVLRFEPPFHFHI